MVVMSDYFILSSIYFLWKRYPELKLPVRKSKILTNQFEKALKNLISW